MIFLLHGSHGKLLLIASAWGGKNIKRQGV